MGLCRSLPTHTYRLSFGNNTTSLVLLVQGGRNKAACAFSAVSSHFPIWLAPLSPSNLPPSYISPCVCSPLWALWKHSINTQVLLDLQAKGNSSLLIAVLFVVSLSSSFLSHNVFREYAGVSENCCSSEIYINNRMQQVIFPENLTMVVCSDLVVFL